MISNQHAEHAMLLILTINITMPAKIIISSDVITSRLVIVVVIRFMSVRPLEMVS